MAKLWVQRKGPGLFPTDRASELVFETLPQRVALRIDKPSRPRSAAMHRLFWAFCALVADTLNQGPTNMVWDGEEVASLIKRGTGHVEMIELTPAEARRLGANHVIREKSIAFSNMDQLEFAAFFDRALAFVIEHVCPFLMEGPHKAEIEKILTKFAPVKEHA